MPPKIRIDRNSILDASISMVRSGGWESINARDLAKVLECSTQPIFREFENMESLKQALQARAWDEYVKYISSFKRSTNHAGVTMGTAYVKFAQDEKNLFKLIFLTNSEEHNTLDEMVYDADNSAKIAEQFMTSMNVERDAAYKLYFHLSVFMNGLASLVATNKCCLSDAEIESLILDNFYATAERLRRSN